MQQGPTAAAVHTIVEYVWLVAGLTSLTRPESGVEWGCAPVVHWLISDHRLRTAGGGVGGDVPTSSMQYFISHTFK